MPAKEEHTLARTGLPSFRGLAKRSFWLYFGAIWLLAGTILLITSIGMAVEERTWASDAVGTTGIVLTKQIVPADSDSSTEYRVRFRFTTAAGTTVEGDRAVDVAIWEAVTERGPIQVYYLPSSPSSARLEPGGDTLVVALFALVGVLGGGFGAFLVVRSLLGIRRSRRLMQTGLSAQATVTSVDPTNVTFNRQPQFKVRYSYRDQAGGEHVGDSGYLEWEEASSWHEGDTVDIRYDASKPNESLWVGEIAPPPVNIDAPPRVIDAPPPG